MHKTLFDTPVINTLLRWLAALILFCCGWKAIGKTPDDPKYVLIAAPHTSNWDLFFMLAIALKMRIKIYWMGKEAIFKFPFRGFMMWMGGIPVDRSKSNDMVKAIADIFSENETLAITVPPEGTRSHTVYWKTGFYHIANTAQVPICCGFLDFKKREGGIGPLVYPTGDIDKDMVKIKAFYSTITGKYPNRFQNASEKPKDTEKPKNNV